MRLVLVRHGLNRISLPPIKPVQRFVAKEPNELWQVDIMGKVRFPLVGDLYLILALDDHSRFILSGAFFFRQFKVNVFLVLYRAFMKWGLPQGILSDRGSQFKAHHRHGEADYQWYAKRLGIEVIYANRAQTKDQASYCTSLGIFEVFLNRGIRSLYLLPWCGLGNGSVMGSKRSSFLSFARIAWRSPFSAKRRAV